MSAAPIPAATAWRWGISRLGCDTAPHDLETKARDAVRLIRETAMTAFERLFLAHPRRVGETYGGHCLTAFAISARMVAAGLACAVHGIFPFLFETAASRTVKHLSEDFAARRFRGAVRSSRAEDPASWANVVTYDL